MSRPLRTDRLPDEAEVRRRVDEVRARAADGRMDLVGESGGDPVSLARPSAEWAARFGEIRQALAAALGPAALRVDHVGSTSVPGIKAKPVIDVQVCVPDIDDEESYLPQIEALGWPLRSREPGHRFFRDPAGLQRRVHVHVCEIGSKWERDHLLFRDYLRAHRAVARAYEALKHDAAAEYRDDRWAYTEAKGPFIEEALELAEDWAAQTNWRP